MKKGSGKRKGSKWERDFCTLLSKYWTEGKSDSVFWRTSNSGGRATVRGRKRTSGQYGDVCSTDPCSLPFTELFTVELKKGYNKYTIADLLDAPANAAKQQYGQWIEQAQRECEQAGVLGYLLIVMRDRRVPLVFFSHMLLRDLRTYGVLAGDAPCPFATFTFSGDFEHTRICCCHLEAFLKELTPQLVKQIHAKKRK